MHLMQGSTWDRRVWMTVQDTFRAICTDKRRFYVPLEDCGDMDEA